MDIQFDVSVKKLIHRHCQLQVYQAIQIHGKHKGGSLTYRGTKSRGAENAYAEPVIDYEQYCDIQQCRKSRDRIDTPEAVFYNAQ